MGLPEFDEAQKVGEHQARWVDQLCLSSYLPFPPPATSSFLIEVDPGYFHLVPLNKRPDSLNTKGTGKKKALVVQIWIKNAQRGDGRDS